MSDVKISQLSAATVLEPADLLAISKSLGGGKWESKSITGEVLLNSISSTRLLKVSKDGTRDADTIAQAIAIAVTLSPTETNPVAIEVYPGSFYENNPIIIPQWVSIRTIGGQYSSAIIAQNDGDIFISSGNGLVDGLSIIGGISYSNVAYKSISPSSPGQISNCIIINCHTGLLSDGGSITASLITGLSFQRGFDKFISSINGGFIAATSCNLSTIIAQPSNGYYCSGSGSELYIWSCTSSGSANGIYVDNSGYVDCFSGHFEDSTNAVYIGPNGYNKVRCVSTIIEDSISKDIIIESATSSLSYVGAFDSSKFSIVDGATVSSQANDANTGGGLSIGKTTAWNSMNIGTPGAIELGKDINVNIGEGSSFVNDQYGNPIVEYWSYDDTAPSGSKFSRFTNNAGTQLTGANDAIIVGCKYQFPAIRLNVNTVMSLVSPSDYLVTEYWNGSTWVDLAPTNSFGGGGVACYRRSDYEPRNHNLFKHVETEYVECSHVLYDNGDWTDDINILDQIPLWDANEPFYAIRFRNQQALASGMVFSAGQIKPHSFVFASSGKQVNFGVYRTDRTSYMDSAAFANDPTYPASFTNIQVSPNISYVNVPVFKKTNANPNNISRMAVVFLMPYDIDTSSPLHLNMDGTAISSALGNIVSTIHLSRIDSKNPPLAFPLTDVEIGPQITSVPGLSNAFVTIEQEIDISGYNAGDTLFISFDRLADDPDDTYSGDFIIGDIVFTYKGKFV